MRPYGWRIAAVLNRRSVHLYRAHALVHGKRVVQAFADGPAMGVMAGDEQYVGLGDPSWREQIDADYLVLHLDLPAEVERYWKFVFGEETSELRTSEVRAYMERQERYGVVSQRVSRIHFRALKEALGEPLWQDAVVAVWRLRS